MHKRLLKVPVLFLAATVMLGASNPSKRFDKLGHSLMCTCSCGEILLECNHMGCPDSPKLIANLHTQLDSGASDSGILHSFAEQYGAIVLAAPIRGGFDLVAWIMPFAVLALGLLGITWLMHHWRSRHTAAAALVVSGSGVSVSSDHLRDRIRRDTTFEP